MTTLLEKPAPTEAPAPPRGRTLVWVGGIVGAVLLASGAVSLVSLALYSDTDRATSTASYTYGPAGTVELVADGDVTVTTGAQDVRVDTTAQVGLASTSYTATQRGDRLTIEHRCSWYGSCRASLDVAVPRGTAVVLRATDGTVRASDLTGDLDVRAGDGRVSVARVDGRVAIRASDGAVDVQDISGDVAVRANDGRVDVASVQGSVVADSSDGRVTVDAVQGNVDVQANDGDVLVYGLGVPVAVNIRTDDGRQTVTGPTDSEADQHVNVVARDGDVTYDGLQHASAGG